MPKITTFLTYEAQAEEAAKFYVSVFPNSKIKQITHYGDAGPEPKGRVMTVTFELDGQEFVALNGGSHFKFSDGISLVVNCKTQEEVDRYSEQLSAGGGEVGPCGWLKDRFGVSWQITPTVLIEMTSDPDPVKAQRVFKAMLKMHKIVIADLQKAYAG